MTGSFSFGLQRDPMTNDTGHQPLSRRSYADSAKIADLQQQVVTDVMSDAVVEDCPNRQMITGDDNRTTACCNYGPHPGILFGRLLRVQ